MASMTMTASFLGGSTAAISKQVPAAATTNRRGIVMIRASKVSESDKIAINKEESSSNGRRELVFAVAAAAAAACSIAKIAMADEPPRGSIEAKKKYAPICVTMPTARICRK